jgi:hypothetical protein
MGQNPPRDPLVETSFLAVGAERSRELKRSLLIDFDNKDLSDFERDVLPDLERRDSKGLVAVFRDVVPSFFWDLRGSALFKTEPLPSFDLVSLLDLDPKVLENLVFVVLRDLEVDDLRALSKSDLLFLDAAPLRDF